MTAPLVSCVVPVHDGAAYLAEALDSILAQTHRPVEVLVVDDASTDGSAAIAARYGPPVRVLQRSQRGGAGAARATGVEAAAGEYVSFLDADDLWLPEKLERQLAHLNGPSPLHVSFCEIENFWEAGCEDEADRWNAAGRIRGTYTLPTALARRTVLVDVPLDASRRHLDHAAWVLKLRYAGIASAVLPAVLVRRRRHASNKTRLELAETYDALFDLLKSAIDRGRQRAL